MIYNIITTQPNIYNSFLSTGLIARGIEKELIKINIFNLYDYAFDKHKSIDDTPYGGGAGMVLRVDVVDKAISKIKNQKSKIILLTPQGKKFKQCDAKRFSKYDNLIIISGRFEGYDERIRDLVDFEISIGDFVLTSGDIPVMAIIDATSRQIPGFIENKESLKHESFNQIKIDNSKLKTVLEYPQYTRPYEHNNKRAPKILLSGNHNEISKWRAKEALKKTHKKRKDLLL